jgi:hypothetical protein
MNTLDRRFMPHGALKVSDKLSDAVAYGALKINESERAHYVKPIIGGEVPVYASSDFSETP